MNKRTAWFIGLSTATLTVALPLGPTMANKVMGGDFSAFSAIKWSSIVAAIGLLLFFLVRQGVFANENLEEGERGFRRRWGKIVINKKTGEPKVLMPGKKHFYVKHMYDIVVVSVRVRSSPEEPSYDKPIRATYYRKNIMYVAVINWQVIDELWRLYASVTQVYQVNRAAEGNDALENYVLNETLKTVRRCLSKFEIDNDGLPVITIDPQLCTVPDEMLELQQALIDNVGVQIKSIDTVLLSEAPEEAIRNLKGTPMFP